MGEWGPWIEHDGKGCPCVGQYVHIVRRDGREAFAVAGSQCHAAGVLPNGGPSAWLWAEWPGYQSDSVIIRYRIRRPKGMAILEQLLADLPAPVGPKVDA